MQTGNARAVIQNLLSEAGITVNGNQPWDIQVHNDQFFSQALTGGSLQVGESYIAKWWDCLKLDEFFSRVLRHSVDGKLPLNWKELMSVTWNRLVNFQTIRRSFLDVGSHYNLGNKLFSKMLDQRLMYTCAYWKDARTLDEAQEKKLELTCRKLYLQPGMYILDVGCGWGGFAKFAAERYGVHVTGITLSEEQARYAKHDCAGLPVDIQLLDYRKISGWYDRIVSLGMFEHVGYKNYRTYMQIAHDHLQDDGLFLLHTIGNNVSNMYTDPWLHRYIFPNSLLPSIAQIGKAAERLFVVEDWHNFSADYDKTLMAWHHNFVSHWSELQDDYDEKFYRTWTYYLLCCAGSFRSRKNQLWQIVFSRNGTPGGYTSVR
jgi:cyclopropane-fatty-acyl-phospholipid synthase